MACYTQCFRRLVIHTRADDQRHIQKSLRHFPSLDGIRAISILLVLLGHLDGKNFRGRPIPSFGFGDTARLGVEVFFVISGFLITSLLLSEHARTGGVSLKLFYARRALRIFPASYFFLMCMAIAWTSGMIHLRGGDFIHGITYSINYFPYVSWEAGHLWSLSDEEQFYLIWPIAFAILGPRRGYWVIGAMLLVAPLARIAAWAFVHGPYRDLAMGAMFPMVADTLATGCLLASIRPQLERQEWYLRLFNPIYSVTILLLLLELNRYMGYTLVRSWGISVRNIFIAFLIHRSVYRHEDAAGKFLNWKPVSFIGVLSYSLYLWQQPFLNKFSSAWVASFPQNLGITFLAALASYFLLERPLLKLRHRLRA